jgi:putative two-component system response regulator
MADGASRDRVLIVDDEPANRDLLRRVLADYDTRTAVDGTDAFAVLERGDLPNLILLDLTMPKVSGFQVCERLKRSERWRDIPVIFVTGNVDADNESEGLALGAVDYITKPFSPSVVQARVKTHLALKAANTILEQQVAARTVQLADALSRAKSGSVETVVRLSRAAEYRDEDTGEHLLRIGYYSAAVGRALGLADEVVESLLRAAPMHDIGKIGIPDSVLLKRGPLDPAEWAIVKQHPLIGAKILAGSESDVIRLGEVVALTHHERWDGSGYPAGLAGLEIPLAGRIVAVVDVFDAVASKRPYKESFPLDRSFEIVRGKSGNAFDASVVDAFFCVEADVREIHATFQDRHASPLVEMAGVGRAPSGVLPASADLLPSEPAMESAHLTECRPT